MSTRGAIARVTGPASFAGVYHHWDSYPSGLGKTLYHLYRGHFHGDLDAMLSALIDDHPAGWSTINGADFELPAGFRNDVGGGPEGAHGPICYCHGARHEEANEITQENASGCGCEYVYAFKAAEAGGPAGATMHVLSSYDPGGSKMIGWFGFGDPDATWRLVATVDLDGREPDWESIR